MDDNKTMDQELKLPALELIAPSLKSGQESLTKGGKPIDHLNLLKFWQWNGSNLLSNATRGVFSEFIVASALGVDLSVPREEWAAYDLSTPEGLKVEVKSAAYVQSWHQKKFSSISFDIKEKRHWDAATGIMKPVPGRHADVYVFCLFKNKEVKTLNPLDMDQWEFYVLPVKVLDEYERSRHSITLNSLRKLTSVVSFEGIRALIQELPIRRK